MSEHTIEEYGARFRAGGDSLLHVERHLGEDMRSALAEDVRSGLSRLPKSIPPKYFYDEYGSRLFDEICDLPEYYPTRTERALLRAVAGEIIASAEPTHLVELGSGAARKTRVLLDALVRRRPDATYVPLDVDGSMLLRASLKIRTRYPRLRVHGIVADYEQHLELIPPGRRRLVIFLGSSIGNFTPEQARRFMKCLTRQLHPGDFVLIGMDLVKPVEVLSAAYNDSAGVTAEFNRNVLRVINRELAADFDPANFEHVAFFNAEASQIEMHLQARQGHAVRVSGLGLTVPFAAGERMLTEISRKFTRGAAERLFEDVDCDLLRWLVSKDEYFALALGAVR